MSTKTELRLTEEGFDLVISFSDLSMEELRELLNRSEKPLTDEIGATLLSKSTLAVLEVVCLYFSDDPDSTLKLVRDFYKTIAYNKALKLAEENQDANSK